MVQLAAASQTWKFPGLELAGMVQLAAADQTWKFPGLKQSLKCSGLEFVRHGTTCSSQPNLEISRF